LAVLDLSDPARPRYAEHRADMKQNVGSVGKLVVALALFQALADAHPDDLAARTRVLKTTVVTADPFSQVDSHTVRIYDVEARKLTRRSIQVGDRAMLYEWLDWMLSPSSNGAAGMVMREAMLLRHFGKAYPPSEEQIQRFFKDTPRSELTALYDKTFVEPLRRNGLPAAHGAGPAGRRVLQPRDQAADLRHRAAHPLCVIAGAGPGRRVLQVGLAFRVRAGEGLHVQALRR
ncbi:MAG: hypothetical protein MUF16_28615, partial [Burkholderiaceae bacterium]|nr:hypothetical protein [Burkholderiaceae bacterium]